MAYPLLAAAKVYMGIAGAGDDVTIGHILAGVIEQVEQASGRIFVASAGTRKFPLCAPHVTQSCRMLTFFEDLVSVTTLTNGDAEVIPATAYDLIPGRGVPYYQLLLRSEQRYRFETDGDGTPISLLGSWGSSTACPDDIFQVILELTNLGYDGRGEGSGTEMTDKGTIVDKSVWPDWVKEAIDRRRRWVL